ncbi:MAG: hypothetical protein U0821_27430 [Chloroflexota bacterium]
MRVLRALMIGGLLVAFVLPPGLTSSVLPAVHGATLHAPSTLPVLDHDNGNENDDNANDNFDNSNDNGDDGNDNGNGRRNENNRVVIVPPSR